MGKVKRSDSGFGFLSLGLICEDVEKTGRAFGGRSKNLSAGKIQEKEGEIGYEALNLTYKSD